MGRSICVFLFVSLVCAQAEVVSYQLHTMEGQVQSQAIPYGTDGEQNGPRTGFPPYITVFL